MEEEEDPRSIEIPSEFFRQDPQVGKMLLGVADALKDIPVTENERTGDKTVAPGEVSASIAAVGEEDAFIKTIPPHKLAERVVKFLALAPAMITDGKSKDVLRMLRLFQRNGTDIDRDVDMNGKKVSAATVRSTIDKMIEAMEPKGRSSSFADGGRRRRTKKKATRRHRGRKYTRHTRRVLRR